MLMLEKSKYVDDLLEVDLIKENFQIFVDSIETKNDDNIVILSNIFIVIEKN